MSPLPRDKSLWLGQEGDLLRGVSAEDSYLSSLWGSCYDTMILGEGRCVPALNVKQSPRNKLQNTKKSKRICRIVHACLDVVGLSLEHNPPVCPGVAFSHMVFPTEAWSLRSCWTVCFFGSVVSVVCLHVSLALYVYAFVCVCECACK